MFEPSPLTEESFDMHFYILVDKPEQWPAIEFATIIQASTDALQKLAQTETDIMDVLLICCESTNFSTESFKTLEAQFRIVLTFQKDSTHLADFQDTIAELCWASYHSHNFDIMDANSLLSGGLPIISANQHMIDRGWKSQRIVDSAILFIHDYHHQDEKELEQFITNAQTALNIDSISAISLGQRRRENTSQYSVLAKQPTKN